MGVAHEPLARSESTAVDGSVTSTTIDGGNEDGGNEASSLMLPKVNLIEVPSTDGITTPGGVTVTVAPVVEVSGWRRTV